MQHSRGINGVKDSHRIWIPTGFYVSMICDTIEEIEIRGVQEVPNNSARRFTSLIFIIYSNFSVLIGNGVTQIFASFIRWHLCRHRLRTKCQMRRKLLIKTNAISWEWVSASAFTTECKLADRKVISEFRGNKCVKLSHSVSLSGTPINCECVMWCPEPIEQHMNERSNNLFAFKLKQKHRKEKETSFFVRKNYFRTCYICIFISAHSKRAK